MIRCSDNSIYTGITTDILRRFFEHKSGKGAKYTKSLPAVLVEALWITATKENASKLEYRIKELKKEEKEDIIKEKVSLSDIICDIREYEFSRFTKNQIEDLIK